MNEENKNIQQFEYKAEMKQLLNIIVNSLYTHPEIFLRELISNAADALNKVRLMKLSGSATLSPEDPLEIRIKADPKEKTFSIEDSGIGMDKDELINNIGTIAKSGTLEFINKLKDTGASKDEQLIGQFGVGFYSVFMVTNEVEIETRNSEEQSKGYRWRSSGQGSFSIEQVDRPKRGTRISFKLKEDFQEFAEEYRIKEIIKKYSNFVNFPIFLNDSQVNTLTAIWQKKSGQTTENELNEFYKFISGDFQPPMGHIHISIEGAVSFKSLLFIPAKAPMDFMRLHDERSVKLYSNKILIQDDCKDILPEYLRFMKGVVDTADMPLNVSREITQVNPTMEKIKKIVSSKILSFLEGWAKESPEKYDNFYKNFSPMLKAGLNSDLENREKITELLRFESTSTENGKSTSLKEYVSRMKDGQKSIYYLSGENRLNAENNPKLEYFKSNGIEVLFAVESIDVFIMPAIHEYDKKQLESIDKADLDLLETKIEQKEDNLSESLVKLFKETLKEKVAGVKVSRRLVNSAATLTADKNGLDPQTEKIMKLMNKDFTASKRLMEINISHPLIKNLSRMYIADTKNPLIAQCIEQIYEGALLLDGNLENPAEFVKRMNMIMEKTLQ